MKKRLISVVLVLLLTISLLPSALAENDFPVAAGTFRFHQYAVYDVSMTWTQAKSFCENLGGYLAAVTSEEEQTYLASLIAQAGDLSFYWLGGTDEAGEGDWRWVSGENWDYANWSSANPNNDYGTENYAGICNVTRSWTELYEWNDFTDDGSAEGISRIGLICEFDNISNWARTELEKAADMNLIPETLQNADLTKPITRAEFAAIAVKVFENLAGVTALPAVSNPFTDTQDVQILKAYNLGITNGTSAATFSPDTLLNREQCATMLTRVFKRATLPGWTLETDSQFSLSYEMPAPFADDTDISGYAKESVYFMVANGIINGMGNQLFVPRNTTTEQEAVGYANATREQALVIALRMVENLG